ncbi:MAG: TerB family tellurite resistance protein [Thermodesulfobacteriota bacterium]
MLRGIKGFFNNKIRPQEGVTSRKATEDSLRLATAALLIEAVKADSNVAEGELEAVKKGLSKKFGIDTAQTETLISLAEEEAAEAVSLYGFTSLINKGFKYDDKKQIIELLWEVVYADKVLDKHEEHLVRKVSDLLQVSHRDFIDAKLCVKNKGLKTGGEDE